MGCIENFEKMPLSKQRYIAKQMSMVVSDTYQEGVASFIGNERLSHNPGYFHPSGVAGCPRKVAYDYIGEKQYNPQQLPQEFQRYGTGTAIHEQLERYYQAMNKGAIKITSEQRINDTPWAKKLHISGRYDHLLEFSDYLMGDTPLRVVVDVKTAAKGTFNSLRSSPKAEYVPQMLLYMLCLDAPIGHFHYYCKDSSLSKHIAIWFDRVKVNALIHKLEMIRETVSRGELPDPEPNRYVCTNLCSYAYMCEAYAGDSYNFKRGD